MKTVRRLRKKQPRAKEELAPPAEEVRLRNWEGVRAFLEVAHGGSFRAAAQTLGISVNTLRREVDEFEREIRATLFTRHIDGVRLTKEGDLLLSVARRMEMASFDLLRVGAMDLSLRGEVRLSVTEGLGTFWLAPRLVEFQQAHPGLLVEINCNMHPADVLRLESDVAVQLVRPAASDLRIVKLGRMHTMPFASPGYVATHGRPKDKNDLKGHRLVLQVADQVYSKGLYERFFPDIPQADLVSIRTNVSSAHYWAVVQGAGIGFLPTYAKVLGTGLEPIDMNMRFAFDILLVYHPDSARIPRVRRLVDWLIAAFSPRRYPWFGDEFIHPRDLPDEAGGLSLSSLHEGG
jgi:DNA-binding transcriptional LysR family regulator